MTTEKPNITDDDYSGLVLSSDVKRGYVRSGGLNIRIGESDMPTFSIRFSANLHSPANEEVEGLRKLDGTPPSVCALCARVVLRYIPTNERIVVQEAERLSLELRIYDRSLVS